MDSRENLVRCSHCIKEVAKENLPMHEVHCQRFLCLCPVCNESIPKDQLEKHKEEQHTLVRCQKCRIKMERCKLPDHETDECRERPQTCEFCELELPLSALKDHAVTCGSRTERCPDCKQYVTLKDRTDHATICSSTFSEEESSDNDEEFIYEGMKHVAAHHLQDDQKFGGYIFYNQTDEFADLRINPESTEPDEHPSFSFLGQLKNKGGGAMGYGDVNQISSCPHCHLALPLQTLQWHENKCKIFGSLKLTNKKSQQ